MDKIMEYIFGGLDSHEKVLKKVCKAINTQNRINKYFVFCVLAGCAYVYTNEKNIVKLEKANKALVERLDELEEKTLGEE